MGWKTNKENKIITSDQIDKPSKVDYLNYKKYAYSIAEIIRDLDDKNTPLTIGVFGEWGSGKTSFLNQIEKQLNIEEFLNKDKKNIIKPVWFNAWKYKNEENLWAALLQLIINHVDKTDNSCIRKLKKLLIWKNNFEWKSGNWEIIRFIFKIFLLFSLFILFAIILYSNQIPLLGNETNNIIIKTGVIVLLLLRLNPTMLYKLFDIKINIDFSKFSKNESYKDKISFWDKFSSEFKKIVNIVRNGDNPLVIFIDDLDRCFPEETVEILESIKNLLDVENVVFIITVDPVIIENLIFSKYQKMINIPERRLETFNGKDYFEKIIQLPFALPALSEFDIKEYISKIYLDENIDEISDLIANCFSRNPRKIKRIIILFNYHKRLYLENFNNIEFSEILLLKLLILQDQYKNLYIDIINDNSILINLQNYFLLINKYPPFYEMNNKDKVDISNELKIDEYQLDYLQEKSKDTGLKKILLYKEEEYELFYEDTIGSYIYLLRTLPVYKTQNQENFEDYKDEFSEFTEYLTESNKNVKNDILKSTDSFDFVEKNRTPINNKVRRNISNLFVKKKRIFIEGEFGIGKTYLIEYLFSIHIRAIIENNESVIFNNGFSEKLLPIKIDCSDIKKFNYYDPISYERSFNELIDDILGFDEEKNKKLYELLEDGKCLLLIDGIDKLRKSGNEMNFLNWLKDFMNKYKSNYILITARPLFSSYQSLNSYNRFKFTLWDDDKVISYLRSNNVDNEKINLISDFIINNKMINSLVYTPLSISHLIQIVDKNPNDKVNYTEYINLELQYLLQHIKDDKTQNIHNLSKIEILDFLKTIAELPKMERSKDIISQIYSNSETVDKINSEIVINYLIKSLFILKEIKNSYSILFRDEKYIEYFLNDGYLNLVKNELIS